METVSTEALLELRFMLEQSIDVQFQAWMAATFAVIVAVYSARADLKIVVRICISILYSLAVGALWFRWMTEGIRINTLIDPELINRGVDSGIHILSGYLRFMTYWLGSIVTFIAIFYLRDDKKNIGE